MTKITLSARPLTRLFPGVGLWLIIALSCQVPKADTEQQSSLEGQFSEHIRTVDARTPEEQKAGFTLPPGA